MDYTLRKAKDSDLDYLLQLRRLTMDDYLSQDGVDISDEEHVFRIKFNFADAKIILVNGVEAGLFKASYTASNSQWYIYQVQIHPSYQGFGIGRKLIFNLCQQALRDNLSVGLSVLKSNPAKSLYERLGFTVTDSNNSEFEMAYNT
ncbi:histone acetyltransferase [Shewanella sp. 10N.286.51.B7]|uniref:GNAT family N-acetyltransferase n=1 Tax=unclassified Shewanella TaxID=196818 RepID=UPI000C851C5C|nr:MULTISPECIES: N-acetyltransferase [unclassified Shewanella]MCC4834866.1 GNAT family N-acetyltransferase [Shewanella sp. 10N.7]PMG78506.1 histone acetyltransferase [Shewanella sp. 10N.286.51.B7]